MTPVSCDDIVFPEMINFTMPRYGFMQKGTVTRWLKREGEPVSKGELIVQIESDKVANDVECPADGFLKTILVPEGEEQEVFKSIALIAESRQELEQPLHVPEAEEQGAVGVPKPTVPPAGPVLAEIEPAEAVKASPVARKMAREHGVDLSTVRGSGPGGRITEKDVQLHLRHKKEQALDVIEEVLSPTRRAVALHLTQGLQRSAQVTQSLLCSCGALLASKERAGVSITAVMVKLLGSILAEFPRLNAHLIDQALQIHKVVNIGVAVHSEHGLVVPVVRNVRATPLQTIQEQLESLASRARAKTLDREDLQGSTFTISNLGMYKTDMFTPLLNFPEVGILGMGRIFKDIQVDEAEQTRVVSKVWLSLTYDHRAIDGVEAASFLGRLGEALTTVEELSQAVQQA